MINIERLRQNPEEIKKAVARKGYEADLDAILTLDQARRDIIGEIENLRQQSNQIAEKGKDITEEDKEKGKDLKDKIKVKEGELAGIEEQLLQRMTEIPNPPFEEVPEKDEVVKREGKKPELKFKPKDHLEIGTDLDILDFQRGAKVAGSQFYYLKNEGALLELALINYSLNLLGKRGFQILFTPDLAREEFYKGTGYMPKGDEAQTYEIEGEDLGLIATAEVTLAGYHAREILEESNLPIKYAGLSHCFRKEAGAYGKESKGLYRVHQFTKVEMFVFCKPENSSEIHEELLEIEEEIFKNLKIPYRVINIGVRELGSQAAKKYDLEAWMPGREVWGEITSTSNTTDYQSRNLEIKYKSNKNNLYAHTLNGTAVALSRTIVAILENYQQEDGSVKMPKVLHKYLSFKKITPK